MFLDERNERDTIQKMGFRGGGDSILATIRRWTTDIGICNGVERYR
jgi:hypothetical protein